MPCELNNNCLKENAWKAFERLIKIRRNMGSLQTHVVKEAKETITEFIGARLADLQKTLTKIEASRMRYCVSVLLCTFLKLFLGRQVFQDRCSLRLTSDRTARF